MTHAYTSLNEFSPTKGNVQSPTNYASASNGPTYQRIKRQMETYNTIKDTAPLHEYLTELGDDWPALIPIQFTNEGEHYTERHATKPTKRQRPKETATSSARHSNRSRKRFRYP